MRGGSCVLGGLAEFWNGLHSGVFFRFIPFSLGFVSPLFPQLFPHILTNDDKTIKR